MGTDVKTPTETEKIAKSNRKWAIIIGVGLALFPLHNQWLADVTAINGEAVVFLPAFGTVVWILATLFFLRDNWKRVNLGDKRIFVPLLVIVASTSISGFTNADMPKDKIAPLLMSAILFATYIVSRSLGSAIFRMLIPFVLLGAIIAVALGILNPGVPNGGLITNYCASTGFLIFATLVNQGKWQWILCIVAIVGVFFVGALESVFIMGVLGIAVLVRRDFSRQFLIVMSVTLGIVGIWALLGYLVPLYTGNNNISVLFGVVSGTAPINENTLSTLTTGRWPVIIRAMQDIHPFGHGFSLSTTGGGIVHNIPLIIVHQIGILAAVAWVFVTVYCLIKTKWKYIWIAVIAMSVFDHYVWTQFLPLWWCLVGVSTTSTLKNDYIFKRVAG